MTIQFTAIDSNNSGINHPFENQPGPPMGGLNPGAAAADFNDDGWVDLYVTRRNAPDILYQNNGDGTFTDVTVSSGINRVDGSNGAAFADIDNDGDQDLYVTTVNEDFYLYINDGNGSFNEEAIIRNAAINIGNTQGNNFSASFGNGIAFGDYDRDGYLDLHTNEWSNTEHYNTRLLHNLGAAQPGYFEDVTELAEVSIPNVFAFASHFADFDDDGYQDLVIAGDFSTSKLFWNNGDGTFTDGTTDAGFGTDENGMGLTLGDYDGDGRLDIFITSIYGSEDQAPCDMFPDLQGAGCENGGVGITGNRLYRNEGNRKFSDQTDTANVRDGGWGWGTNFFDFDNDGDLDLAMTNGFIPVNFPDGYDNPYPNDQMRLWRNDDGVFTEIATLAGVTDRGLGQGLLTFDYDKDGDLDMYVTNNGSEPLLYRNDSENSNDWLKVKTQGTISNADGVGAVVSVIATEGGTAQIREISASSDYLGQSEITAHFGLGDLPNDLVHQVRIEWLSGIVQEFDNVSANELLVAVEPAPPSHDLNGDSQADIFWRDPLTGENKIFIMDGGTVAEDHNFVSASPDWELIALDDFNGDSKADLFGRNNITGANAMFLMDGTNIIDTPKIKTMPLNWEVAAVGDLNGDSQVDIFWRDPLTGENQIFIMDNGEVAGDFDFVSASPEWELITLDDFNGDGKADLFGRNNVTGANAMFLMDGVNIMDAPAISSMSLNWEVAAVGDLNGDSQADIVWRDPLTGENQIFIMDNGEVAGDFDFVSAAPEWEMITLDDFNGDGKADLFGRNNITGANAMFLMDGAKIIGIPAISSMSLNWEVAAVDDFNRDGQADIFWRDSSTGDNRLFLMDDGMVVADEELPSVSSSFELVNQDLNY